MRRFHRFSAYLAVLPCAALGITVLADTGSPPPPVVVIGAPSPATKAQVAAYQQFVMPAYLASLPNGLDSDSYPMFVLFVATYPSSVQDRAAFLQLYVLEKAVVTAELE